MTSDKGIEREVFRKGKQLLVDASDLLERTGFTPYACAVNAEGVVVSPREDGDAVRYCVSGAARAIGFHGNDGDGSIEEKVYLRAMQLFCDHVGAPTVMAWADSGKRNTHEVVAAMRAAAQHGNDHSAERDQVIKMLRKLAKLHVKRALLRAEGTTEYIREVAQSAVLDLAADWIEKGRHQDANFNWDE